MNIIQELTWEDIGGLKFKKDWAFDYLPAIKKYQEKEYKLPEIKIILKELKEKINNTPIEHRWWYEIDQDMWIERKNKFKVKKATGTMDIAKAKAYPIDQMLEFKGGFANCPFHDEKTGSAKYYKNRNKLHCFGCGMDADSIDVYQKLNNVDFGTAIKALS